MESVTFVTENPVSALKSKNKLASSPILNNILQEYCLKRNTFDPNKPSPNKFVKKLHLRMKHYYNNLYKVNSFKKK